MPQQKTSAPRVNAPSGWNRRLGTLGTPLHISGRGLHTGRKVSVRILPDAYRPLLKGIVFRRVRNGEVVAEVAARLRAWRHLPLCSTLEAGNGHQIRTVEHVLAALMMCEIDRAVVELDEEELPILDGSAKEWIRAVQACGRVDLAPKKRFIRVLEPYEYIFGKSRYRIEPASTYSVDVSLREPGFGLKRWHCELTPEMFARDIAPARSYGRVKWAIPALLGGWLTDKPLLRGARPDSVAMVFGSRVLGGMRVPDELLRHRVLDMVGDFALAGVPILGKVTVVAPSHRRNQKFMRVFLAQKTHWEWATAL